MRLLFKERSVPGASLLLVLKLIVLGSFFLPIFDWGSARAQPVVSVSQSNSDDPSEVKQKLHDILSRPEFVTNPQDDNEISNKLQSYFNNIKATWDTFTRWLKTWYERLQELFSFRGGAIRPSSGVFIWSFIATCILAALYLIVKYILFIRTCGSRQKIRSSVANDIAEAILDSALARTYEEWMSDADTLANQGKLRDALRSQFLATLLQLDKAGMIEFSRRETNGDHIVRIARSSSPDIATEFRSIVVEFEYFWYGEHNVDTPDYERFIVRCRLIADVIAKLQHTTAGKIQTLVAC
jgi:hypothetical protein